MTYMSTQANEQMAAILVVILVSIHKMKPIFELEQVIDIKVPSGPGSLTSILFFNPIFW